MFHFTSLIRVWPSGDSMTHHSPYNYQVPLCIYTYGVNVYVRDPEITLPPSPFMIEMAPLRGGGGGGGERSNLLTRGRHTGSNCTTNFSAGAVWPASVGNTTVYQACSSIDQASFQSDLQASRYCSSNGTWGDVDLTTCALLPSTAQSFALVWIVFNVTSVNASSVNVVGNGVS